MMAARPHTTFAHTKTVQLIVEEGMDVNTIETGRSLPDFKEEITGIVPNFGGKCFDIMLCFTDTATHLATSDFDYGAERKGVKINWCKNHPPFGVCRCGIPRPRHWKLSKAVWTVKVRQSTLPLLYLGGCYVYQAWYPHHRIYVTRQRSTHESCDPSRLHAIAVDPCEKMSLDSSLKKGIRNS